MINKKIKYILIVVFVIVIAGVITWRQNKQKEEFGVTPNSTFISTSSPVSDETADWAVYQKEEYGFRLKYPSDFEKAEWENFEFSNIVGDFKGFLLAQFKIPSSLIESKFYFPDIRVEIDSTDVCDKLSQLPDVDESLTNKGDLAINNINFLKKERKYTTNPGVSYDGIIYYTKIKGRCYSITLFNIISISGIDALIDQNKITEEQNQIEREKKKFVIFLEQKMLPTFKFLE